MAIFRKKKEESKPPSGKLNLNKQYEENFKRVSHIISKAHHFNFVDDGTTIVFAGSYRFTVHQGRRCVIGPNDAPIDMSPHQINKIYDLIMERHNFLMHHLRSKIVAEHLRTRRHKF